MTPKEKAQELVDKFIIEVRCADRYNYNLESMNLFIAKQCALIAVEEILKACPIELISSSGKFRYTDNYWDEVKTEIENL